jgi:hypothetical protein
LLIFTATVAVIADGVGKVAEELPGLPVTTPAGVDSPAIEVATSIIPKIAANILFIMVSPML